ncbi:MAG: Nif3-like dinuclear metal center hexameric protein [Gemmatimonadota bacterium]
MADLHEMVEYLDALLEIEAASDYPGAYNGLQVDGRQPIERVCVATDACQATIDATIESEAQLLVVHHGLFWGEPLPLTGPAYRRIKALVEHDVAVYSAHLPLDTHPELGNNALLAQALGLTPEGTFGTRGDFVNVGVWAAADLSLDALSVLLKEVCGAPPHVIGGGPDHVRRVGIVTGAGSSMLEAARSEGLDTLVTGEGPHHTYHQALELGMNLIYAGHYATETLGVRALGERLAERFGVEWSFLEVPTGL